MLKLLTAHPFKNTGPQLLLLYAMRFESLKFSQDCALLILWAFRILDIVEEQANWISKLHSDPQNADRSRPQISLLRRSDFLDALQNYFSYYLCDDRKHGDITPSVALKTTAFHGNLNNQRLLAFSGKDIRFPVKSHGELLPRLQLFIVVDDESTGKSFTTIKRFATNFQFFHYAIYGSKIIVLCGSFHFPDLCNNKFFHDSTVSPIL